MQTALTGEEQRIDVDLTHVVDHDRDATPLAVCQDVVEERGLPSAEEARPEFFALPTRPSPGSAPTPVPVPANSPRIAECEFDGTHEGGLTDFRAPSDTAIVTISGSPGPRFLIGATGSIAVTRLPEYLAALRAAFGGTYTVLMTHTATTFLPPHTVGLSAERVIAGEDPQDWPTDKPSRLAADHDIVLVLPATANVLAAAAAGAAPNRLTTVLLATEAPVSFFPHMGTAMWRNSAVRRNVARIREDGRTVVDPVEHTDRDVVTGLVATHPALPGPDAVVDAVRPVVAALAGAGVTA